MTNAVANLVFPREERQKAVQFFLIVAEPLDAKTFSDFIDLNISIWKQLIPDEMKALMREHVSDYAHLLPMLNESLILSWILEARPDLKPVFEVKDGRAWFYRQWAEITGDLGIGK